MGAFARLNYTESINEAQYLPPDERGIAQPAMDSDSASGSDRDISSEVAKKAPQWFYSWEETGLVSFTDHNGDGRMQIRGDNPPDGLANEVDANRDIFVLANPEIAQLPGWVIGLVVAGGLAAALSTAAGLLLVIGSAISHDLFRRTLFPRMKDRTELWVARLSIAIAVGAAGLLGIFSSQLGFVAQVVAIAFGLAAASIFPSLLLGIFWTRMNYQGAIVSMLTGLSTTLAYIYYFKFGGGTPDEWLWGISPEGIGFVCMLIALATGIVVALLTPPPPESIRQLVLRIRYPHTKPDIASE